ncbi:MAG: XamI family restriction endonuclease [Phycisphaerae bacterium]|nr:XamI family restriction endonuclease [Phycisphaerae bacterium]
MAINLDKPHRWKADIAASVDMFNDWFLKFAPQAYRDSRRGAVRDVRKAFRRTGDLTTIRSTTILEAPSILQVLRMATCPPLARDRLVGLAYTSKSFVQALESGRIPLRMKEDERRDHAARICQTITRMIDQDVAVWLERRTTANPTQRSRAATIIADRLCGAVSDPIIRNAQEKRQLDRLASYLTAKQYSHVQPAPAAPITAMKSGTFGFRVTVRAGTARTVNIPVDFVFQPHEASNGRLPVLIEAKSAGDFTNVNKRRKEEATKIRQLRETYGDNVQYLLFLCGYFDSGYLGYEAAEGIDWIWEHRIEDLDQLGL